jgi:ATP-binding cassette subfamily B protein
LTARRRFLLPEVIQSSSMDCGPAALKSVLSGFKINASYARLREACHTSVDGTSIESLEQVARLLGLEASESLLPIEHLVMPEAGALPALVTTATSSGIIHLVVVWRRVGPWVLVMDPVRGRSWVRWQSFARDVFLHSVRAPAAAFATWSAQEEFRRPLRARLAAVGADPDVLLTGEVAWQELSALDAAARAAAAAESEAQLSRAETARAFRAFLDVARGQLVGGPPLGDWFWTAQPVPVEDGEDGEMVILRGTPALLISGRIDEAPANDLEAGEGSPRLPRSPELARALREPEIGTGRVIRDVLRAEGFSRYLGPITAGLALAAAARVFEALLFRAFFDVGQRLVVFEQRLMALLAMVVLVAALVVLEWPLGSGLLAAGRGIEVRLRAALLAKLPRIPDRYFRTRASADMVHRAHAIHRLRALPSVVGRALRTSFELVFTAIGVCLLHPPATALVLFGVIVLMAVPLLAQSEVAQRDRRAREQGHSLSGYLLDGLRGLVAIRAHAAEDAVSREHLSRLQEWLLSARRAAGLVATIDVGSAALGYAFSAWILFDYLRSAPATGWAILLFYWAFMLPGLAHQMAGWLLQLPMHRNLAVQMLEPLTAPEDEDVANTERPRDTSGPPAIAIREVTVEVAGRALLQDLNLSIAAGEHVAVVGSSGAGKSTLVGLLLGWHRPSAGHISVDGAPFDTAAVTRLREGTVWVDPAVYLWNRSLLDNVRYGTPQERRPVAAAIEDAELDDVLGRLPMGLQTSLGEGGGLISGGEGGRVRFARGLARGPARLVVLDEAFRGLERPRRRALMVRARRTWRDATLVCVTHDIAETAEFDRVLVIEDGKLIEDGRPGELLGRAASRYRQLREAEARVAALLEGRRWRRWRVSEGKVIEGGAA